MKDWLMKSVVVTHSIGLHARPSVKFTKLAKGFSSAVEVARSLTGPWFNAKSIVKVMAIKAGKGSTLHLRARGSDAGDAITTLSGFVASEFDEDRTNAASG
ncbi:MAG TPA: HPr family phosphocarrier protein [Aestuariivirga sp.]|jgi:phosphocarrier protein|nr:HPr family phosphocarrier protein [Aestuariivirga sp.]